MSERFIGVSVRGEFRKQDPMRSTFVVASDVDRCVG